jgi:anaerobic selenocysteine-containing dehydrogenase
VERPDGVRADLEIYQALAARLGFGEKMARSAEAWIDRVLAPMAAHGVTRERLAGGGLRKPEAPRVLFQGRHFPTASGRFQLITAFPEAPPALDPGYPLHLMSTSTYRNQSSQIFRKDQQEPPIVTLHPDAAPGLADGALASLASPLGEVVVRLKLDPRQRPDLVIYPKGRWGAFGGPNSLIRARLTDDGEGAAYYDQGVRLAPVG